jgi:hypothetical protein
MSNLRVTITGVDEEPMIVHPERDATHGVYLAEDQVKGDIIDAPVKTEWDSTVKQEGGTQRGVDYEWRDLHLGFHVTDNIISAEEADSMLRMKFAYEEDEWDDGPQRQPRIDIECVAGPFAGTVRSLDLLLAETPEVVMTRDPFADQYFNPQFILRAGQPMWYEPTVVHELEFSGPGNYVIEVENPTDRVMRHSWVVSGEPGTKVKLPDVSWQGGKGQRIIGGPYPTRMISMPEITPTGGGLVATLERGKLMVRDANGTNALGRMPIPGQYFMHRIPHYTPTTELPVEVVACGPAGGRIELRAPMLWSRPFGLRLW